MTGAFLLGSVLLYVMSWLAIGQKDFSTAAICAAGATLAGLAAAFWRF